MEDYIKILVTGGRNFADKDLLWAYLDKLHRRHKRIAILHGECHTTTNADKLSGEWADSRGMPHFKCPANWIYYDKAAGPTRNEWMIDIFKPDLIVACPGKAGTKDCISRAENRGIKVVKLK